ncbi:MAG: hypothetical protein KY468_12690, partial [Armatimonadetes bacterium]|nr:hypothetical protein [Armatimonadota bacterium]
ALSLLGRTHQGSVIPWVPLILAPDWADQHPEEDPPRTGPEIVGEFFSLISRLRPADAPEPPPEDG